MSDPYLALIADLTSRLRSAEDRIAALEQQAARPAAVQAPPPSAPAPAPPAPVHAAPAAPAAPAARAPQRKPVRAVAPPPAPAPVPAPAPTPPAAPTTELGKRIADERQRILAALDGTRWNRVAAADLLGMPRRTFYRRLDNYGIQGPGETRAAAATPAPAPVSAAVRPVKRQPRGKA